MNAVEALSSATLPQPRFRYSQMTKAGSFFQTAGMVALDGESGELEPGGVYLETKKILANLLAALPDFGLELTNMSSARIFTTKFEKFTEVNAAWEEVFAQGDALPARTAVGVSALPLGASVEIEFCFYKK
jgi:2-iminobutanoate/2-iminopropanoate deaminase